MMFLSEGFKNFILPVLIPPIFQGVVPSLLPLIPEILNIVPTPTPTPRFPTFLGNIPFVNRFIPRWILPLGDVALLTGIPSALGFTGAAAFGLKAAINWGVKTVLFGLGAPVAARALHAHNARNYLAQCANLPAGAPQPANPYGLAHGIAAAFQEGPSWFNTLDPVLRISVQAAFYGGLAVLALCAVGKNPFRAEVMIPEIIPPINPRDVIINEAAARMASFDYFFMIFLKVGVPIIGVLVILTTIYQLWNFQQIIATQKVMNQDLQGMNQDLQNTINNPVIQPKILKAKTDPLTSIASIVPIVVAASTSVPVPKPPKEKIIEVKLV